MPPASGTGSGDAILTGIWFDTDTLTLNFAMGYGSAAGFGNLTGPATALHIHGPAAVAVNGPVIFPLTPYHLPAGNPALGGVIFGAVAFSQAQTNDLFQGLNYVNIHTAQFPGGEVRGQLIAELNNPPTVICPAPVTVECSTLRGAPLVLKAQVSDANADPLVVIWMLDGVSLQTNAVAGSTTPVEVELATPFAVGPNTVEIWVSDGKAPPVTCLTMVTMTDTVPPVIRQITATPNSLWPPNHKYVPVTIRVVAADACSVVTSRIVSVTSNEPINGTGDGDTAPDWEITGALMVNLRAERAGTGSGRVYNVTVESRDAAGNTTQGTVQVLVPKSKGRKG